MTTPRIASIDGHFDNLRIIAFLNDWGWHFSAKFECPQQDSCFHATLNRLNVWEPEEVLLKTINAFIARPEYRDLSAFPGRGDLWELTARATPHHRLALRASEFWSDGAPFATWVKEAERELRQRQENPFVIVDRFPQGLSDAQKFEVIQEIWNNPDEVGPLKNSFARGSVELSLCDAIQDAAARDQRWQALAFFDALRAKLSLSSPSAQPQATT